ncbi:unnamed protein product [Heterobilharzia americana]|nr:unnamed protein product [Heterobilharzia americana]CAH8575607.1 unnamed protein product [Heterobilharzia americana]
MADSANKDTPSEHINVKVQGQEGSIIHFKIKKNTPLRKLMMAYCERLGLKQPSVRFIFDGNNVHDTDTPTSLEMEENDTIEVFQTQTGGV